MGKVILAGVVLALMLGMVLSSVGAEVKYKIFLPVVAAGDDWPHPRGTLLLPTVTPEGD